MSFSGRDDEVVCVMVSMNICVGKYVDGSHYYCDVWYYNTGTFWICVDEKITDFRRYPENVYNELSHENEKNQGKGMLWKD